MFDSITELYWVDFQFTSPFSPAVLSHIEIFLVRVDSLKRLIDNPFQDFTFLEIGLLIDQIMVRFNSYLVVICMHYVIHCVFLCYLAKY